MGIIKDFVFMKTQQKQYNQVTERKKADVSRHQKTLSECQLKLDKLIEIKNTGKYDREYFSKWNQSYIKQLTENMSMLDAKIQESYDEITKWTQSLKTATKQLSLMRPNTEKDLTERQNAFNNFAKEVSKSDFYDTLNLRFHSTTLERTEEIISSGGLISSVDRSNGYMETTNGSNEISVSDIHHIQYSINYWTDIQAHNECLPCGCMFILKPQSQEEIDMIEGRQMHNVYFDKNPEQLVAIVTTTENIPKVQNWLSTKGLNKDVVHTFEHFPKELEKMVEQHKEENKLNTKHTIRNDDYEL